MTLNLQRTIFVSLAVLLLFTLINVDSKVGQIFMFFLIADTLMYFYDVIFGNGVQFKIESKTGDRLIGMILALGAFVATMLLNIALKISGVTDISSSLNFYAQYLPYYADATPALANNPWFIVLGWGLLIAVTESLFFLRLFEYILDAVNESRDTRLFTLKKLAAIVLISAIFAFFHITAKGLTNQSAFVMTFAFMAISCILVIKRRQLIEAMTFHVIANTTAIIHNLQLSVMNPYIISLLIAFGIYLLLSRVDLFKFARKVGI
jgi:hypothetical protein